MKHFKHLTICVSGKKGYQDENHAQGEIERGHLRQVSLRSYPCPLCKMWHVTRLRAPKMRIKH